MKIYFLLIIIQYSNCWDLSFLNINNDYYVNSVAVYRSRVFLALPRSVCLNNKSDPTLIEIHWNGDVFNYFSKSRPKIISFQDWNECDHIQDAITLSIEPIKPKLWILDKGNQRCEPKMLSYSLIFNNIVESTKLTNINGKHLNSLVIDPFLEDKFGHRAYIGHIEENTLLVFSLKTLIWWKILLSQPSIFSHPIKADFLAISKVAPELFMTGKNELEIFSLDLEPIRKMEEPLAFETEGSLMTYQVINRGKKLGKASGLETDYMSGLTYFMTMDYAILRWNTQFPLKAEHHRVLFQSYEIFPYISNFFTDSQDAIWALINPMSPNECISQNIPNLQTRVVPILKYNKFTKELELVEINIESKEDEQLEKERADEVIENEEDGYEEENKAKKEYEAKEVYEAPEEYEVKEDEQEKDEETVTKKGKGLELEKQESEIEKEYLGTQKLKFVDSELEHTLKSDVSETENELDNNSNQEPDIEENTNNEDALKLNKSKILMTKLESQLDKDLEEYSVRDSEYTGEYYDENEVSKTKAKSEIKETKKRKKKLDNDRDEAKITDLEPSVLYKTLKEDDISPHRQIESELNEDVDLEIEESDQMKEESKHNTSIVSESRTEKAYNRESETKQGATKESEIEAKMRKKKINNKSDQIEIESEFNEDADLEVDEGEKMKQEIQHNIVSELQIEKALQTNYNQESEINPGTTEESEIEAKMRKKKLRTEKKEPNREKTKITDSYEKLEQDDKTHLRPIETEFKEDVDMENEENKEMKEETEKPFQINLNQESETNEESEIEADNKKKEVDTEIEDVDIENTKIMKSDDTDQYRQIEFDEDVDIEEIEKVKEEKYLQIYEVLKELNNKLNQELFVYGESESNEKNSIDELKIPDSKLKSQETLHQDDIVQYQQRESEFRDNIDLDNEENDKIKQERNLEGIHKKDPATDVGTDSEQEQTFVNKLNDEVEIEMQNEDVDKEKMNESEMESDIEQELEEPEI